MGCLPRSACLGSLSLTQSPNSLVLGEGLEIKDNHLWEHMGNSEWSRPSGLKLSRENLQSRVKEEDSITDVKNASEGQSFHASRPSRLCAQAQSVDDMPFRKQAISLEKSNKNVIGLKSFIVLPVDVSLVIVIG
nr:hypothetical protein [Tanacetum cinerariifolium]